MKTYLIILFIFLIGIIKLSGQNNFANASSNEIKAAEADILSLKGSVTLDNNKDENEATVAISEDNQVVLSYKNDKGNGNLYITVFQGNQWTTPNKLNKIVTTTKWEANECISADGNWLYFTSKQKGGFGGQDVYRSAKLPNGDWGKPANLGPVINTAYDEQAPFSLSDGTLYFSSNKDTTSGSFDIFTSTLAENGIWSDPVNIGYPIDKIEDSTYPFIVESKPKSSLGIKEAANVKKDNYLYTFVNKKNITLTVLSGTIVTSTGGIPDSVKITVADNQTGEILSVYNSYSKTGHYSFILPRGKNNNIVYQADGYLFQSKNIDLFHNIKCYEKTNEIKISPIAVGSKILLNNIFFDSFQATLRPISNVELENIFNLLKTNPSLVIEISCYIISKENIKYNKSISQKRAQTIEEYLLNKGISQERINANGYEKYKSKAENKKFKQNKEIPSDYVDQWIELNIIKK